MRRKVWRFYAYSLSQLWRPLSYPKDFMKAYHATDHEIVR